MRRLRSSARTRWLAITAAAAVTIGLSPAAASAAGAPSQAAPTPKLDWRACGDAGFQCATARVPLDYHEPRGTTIGIAMIRHPATDPAHRIGSLFFNPGGPGGPGVTVLPAAYGQFPADVRARFDLVSFDPRGVGLSDGAHCFDTAAQEEAALAQAPPGFPVGAKQDAAWERTFAQFDASCGRRGDPMLSHMSSGNVARDMDLMRKAVGDRAMSYYGVSYGSVLGATYANLFPNRVRALVLDGNVDPIAWTRARGDLPTPLRMGSDASAGQTMRAFLDRCGAATPQRCPFSAGSPAATRARFATLLDRLRRHPVTIGSPSRTFTYAVTAATVLNALYTVRSEPALGEPGWPSGAELLQELWDASNGQRVTTPKAAVPQPRRLPLAAQPTYDGIEQQLGVWCTDSPNPRDPAAYERADRLAHARGGAVGRAWAWEGQPCSRWPTTDRDHYAGPWNRRTSAPILVVGNTSDPATPYWGSLAMARDLSRTRLLTVTGYGHTELLNKSTCADTYTSRYLRTGSLPPPGTRCRQDAEPFS